MHSGITIRPMTASSQPQIAELTDNNLRQRLLADINLCWTGEVWNGSETPFSLIGLYPPSEEQVEIQAGDSGPAFAEQITKKILSHGALIRHEKDNVEFFEIPLSVVEARLELLESMLRKSSAFTDVDDKQFLKMLRDDAFSLFANTSNHLFSALLYLKASRTLDQRFEEAVQDRSRTKDSDPNWQRQDLDFNTAFNSAKKASTRNIQPDELIACLTRGLACGQVPIPMIWTAQMLNSVKVNFMISEKIITRGCVQAAEHRLNAETGKRGIEIEQEIKSGILWANKSGKKVIVKTKIGGDREIDIEMLRFQLEQIGITLIGKNGIDQASIKDFPIHQGTINDAVMQHIAKENGLPIIFATDESVMDLEDQSVTYTNFGWPTRSLAMRADMQKDLPARFSKAFSGTEHITGNFSRPFKPHQHNGLSDHLIACQMPS